MATARAPDGLDAVTLVETGKQVSDQEDDVVTVLDTDRGQPQDSTDSKEAESVHTVFLRLDHRMAKAPTSNTKPRRSKRPSVALAFDMDASSTVKRRRAFE